MSEDRALELFVAGHISPEVLLARLILLGLSPKAIERRLDVMTSPAAGRVRELLRSEDACLSRMIAMLASSGLTHTRTDLPEAESLGRLRTSFDRAVAASPEASVAAYSLGNPEILARSTTEIVEWLSGQGLVGTDADVLDLGCGTGRVAHRLASCARSVLGVDLSPGMIDYASSAGREFNNLRFRVTDGRGIDYLPEDSVDLIIAVDSLPYLMQIDPALAERHVGQAVNILRPRGNLAVLNLSYRGDLMLDRVDAARWAAAYGYALLKNGELPFSLWDGAVFVFRRE